MPSCPATRGRQGWLPIQTSHVLRDAGSRYRGKNAVREARHQDGLEIQRRGDDILSEEVAAGSKRKRENMTMIITRRRIQKEVLELG